MKKFRYFAVLFVFAIIISALTGCKNTPADDDSRTDDVYSFIYNGKTISLDENMTDVINDIGKENELFEAQSCAFDGLDKTFFYDGFNINTYPKDSSDFVLSIEFTDADAATSENISIGMPLGDVKKVYGENFTEDLGLYTYEKNRTRLSFLIENDIVSAITYELIIE